MNNFPFFGRRSAPQPQQPQGPYRQPGGPGGPPQGMPQQMPQQSPPLTVSDVGMGIITQSSKNCSDLALMMRKRAAAFADYGEAFQRAAYAYRNDPEVMVYLVSVFEWAKSKSDATLQQCSELFKAEHELQEVVRACLTPEGLGLPPPSQGGAPQQRPIASQSGRAPWNERDQGMQPPPPQQDPRFDPRLDPRDPRNFRGPPMGPPPPQRQQVQAIPPQARPAPSQRPPQQRGPAPVPTFDAYRRAAQQRAFAQQQAEEAREAARRAEPAKSPESQRAVPPEPQRAAPNGSPSKTEAADKSDAPSDDTSSTT